MCNLSQGIKEDGIAIGEAGLIMKMYKNGFTAVSNTHVDVYKRQGSFCTAGCTALKHNRQFFKGGAVLP